MSNVVSIESWKKKEDQAFKSAYIQLLKEKREEIEKGLEYLELERESRETGKNRLDKSKAD